MNPAAAARKAAPRGCYGAAASVRDGPKLKNEDLYFKRLINENSRLDGKDLLKHRDEFFTK
jgi:hypothetical protein